MYEVQINVAVTFDVPLLYFTASLYTDLVQLPNGVSGLKRVLGSGKRFMVDYVTWTSPDLKSAGCHPGTLEEFFSWAKQNGSPQV